MDKGLAECAALAEHQTLDPVIADHAAPNRIVEIHHQRLVRAAAVRGDEAHDEVAVHRRGGRGDLLLGAVPQLGIMPGGDAVARCLLVERQDIDPLAIGSPPQLGIERGDKADA